MAHVPQVAEFVCRDRQAQRIADSWVRSIVKHGDHPMKKHLGKADLTRKDLIGQIMTALGVCPWQSGFTLEDFANATMRDLLIAHLRNCSWSRSSDYNPYAVFCTLRRELIALTRGLPEPDCMAPALPMGA